MASAFPAATLGMRRSQNVLEVDDFQPGVLYPQKLLIKCKSRRKIFSEIYNYSKSGVRPTITTELPNSPKGKESET